MTGMALHPNGHLLSRSPDLVVDVLQIPGHPGPPFIDGPVADRCAICGDRPDFYVEDGFVCVREPCAYPDGIASLITLEVPSGRIIVTDDLRPMYQVDDGDLDYNTALGQHVYMQRMAAQGCAYGPVGNSCPGLYRTGRDTYVIASPDYDEATDAPVGVEGKILASITTDLWAYSIADFGHWRAKGGGSVRGAFALVPVPAGVYRFTHHTGERGFDHDARPLVFADIARVD